MDIVEAVANLDADVELHLARILLLLRAFAGEAGTGSVAGLTKLAKLDFMLRYPALLERALEAKGANSEVVRLEDNERLSVESAMVRYRFGPWDHRYREFLNVLVAKDLVAISVEGRAVVIALTNRGRSVAETLAADSAFDAYERRAKLLKKHLNLTATNLMRFIYATFPEIVSLRSNQVIPT